jgi:exonuclease VII small subunit
MVICDAINSRSSGMDYSKELERLEQIIRKRDMKIISLENAIECAKIGTENLKTGMDLQSAMIHDLHSVNNKLKLELETIKAYSKITH